MTDQDFERIRHIIREEVAAVVQATPVIKLSKNNVIQLEANAVGAVKRMKMRLAKKEAERNGRVQEGSKGTDSRLHS